MGKAKPVTSAKQKNNKPQKPRKKTVPHSAWKPGVSGNPKGRPRVGMSLAEVVRRIGDEVDGATRLTRWETAVRAQFNKACAGDVRAFAELCDRGFGKAMLPIFDADNDTALTGKDLEALRAKRWERSQAALDALSAVDGGEDV